MSMSYNHTIFKKCVDRHIDLCKNECINSMTQHVCNCPVEECRAKYAFQTNPKNVNIMFIDMYCQYIDNMPL